MAARTVARSQAERMWMIGGVVLALLVVVIGYFFFVGPQRDETASLESQAADARSQNSMLESKISSLRSQSANLAKYRSQLTTARQALPATSGLPDFLRTLQSLGNATLTTVKSIDVGQPVDVTTVANGQPTAAPSAAPTGNAAAIANAPAAAAAGTTAKPGGVYSLPITAQITGSPGALNGFLQQLQSVQPRAVLITGITEASNSTSSKGGDAQSLQLTMSAFVAPSDATAGAGATGAAPTPGR